MGIRKFKEKYCLPQIQIEHLQARV